VSRVRLLTNNPAKTASLEDFGIEVAERVPLALHPTDANRAYLETKRDRMGHVLPDLDLLHDLTDPAATTEELHQ
jgi:3,4-dihydroxy 2-butanone 4-phosphate synthase / GTP cyclohydrolase II